MTFSSLNKLPNHADMPANRADMKSAPLGAAKLLARLRGRLVSGLYRPPFSYEMRFEPVGTLWGRNNYGTEDTGQWAITDAGELTVSWQNYWDSHTTRAYADGDVLHLFDVDTGNWRTCMVSPVE